MKYEEPEPGTISLDSTVHIGESRNFILIDLPIEPIEDRYSIQWADWFHKAYNRNGIMPHARIYPKSTPMVPPKPGEFLNPETTFGWKYRQLMKLIPWLKRSGRIVMFLHDAWFPGIEMIKYIADMRGLDVKICGFWHAGSYLSNDLLGIKGMHRWARGSEQTWFNLCDAVCVGSQYHKERILASLGQKDTDADKVHVTGYPIEVPKIDREKENIVVWPHRIAEDKHPEVFDRLAKEFQNSGWKFIKSKEVCETKNEYHELLARSKIAVSTATMETFGIAMCEAAAMGCYPFVPNALSYKELFEAEQRYTDFEMLVGAIDHYIEYWKKATFYNYSWMCKGQYRADFVTNNICKIIRRLGEE